MAMKIIKLCRKCQKHYRTYLVNSTECIKCLDKKCNPVDQNMRAAMEVPKK